MTLVLPKELTQARELMNQAKLDEALKIIERLENEKSFSPENRLSALLIKGRIYLYKQRTRKALKTYEIAYQMSQDLGLVAESVRALIGKAYIGFIGDRNEAFTYVLDAEKRLKTLADDSSKETIKQNLLLIKSWNLALKGNLNEAVESAEKYLRLTEEEKIGNKLDLALIFLVLGYINMNQGNLTQALDFAMKSLELNKELNHAVALADDYSLLARIYYSEGDFEQAKQYCKQNLSIKQISGRGRVDTLDVLCEIYVIKGKYNHAIKYRKQTVALTEKLNFTDQLIGQLNSLGYYYRLIGKIKPAIESHERALMLSEEKSLMGHMADSLRKLIRIYIDKRSHEKANRYFSRLSELHDHTKNKGDIDISRVYLQSKAYILKSSTRIRDRMEAQALYKKFIRDRMEAHAGHKEFIFFLPPIDLIHWISHLCDLLLEELSLSNDPEILDEITPLIAKSLEMAEEMRNYHWLAEVKLLQAKLALIQMNIEEAKKLMVEAQRIAELHGLQLLARRISSEHDKLLDQINLWDKIKSEETPMSERIKLASTIGVLEHMQGKRAVEPPESVDEESILLMIIAEGGVLIFSYPFSEEWKFDDELFGGFLTAFNSISDEIFSEGLDRVKFGKQTVLMEQVANFSICYLFKGHTYVARQKLTKFVEEIQNNKSLWQSLEHHYKTSQVLELKDSPQLESLITEFFSSQS